MRRFFLFITLILLILFSGCSGKEPPAVEPAPDSISEMTAGVESGTDVVTETVSISETGEPPGNTLYLEVIYPEDETVISTDSIVVSGKTLPSAIVSVNGKLTPVDAEGTFTCPIQLEPGPNDIQVVASTLDGEETGKVLVIVNIPQ